MARYPRESGPGIRYVRSSGRFSRKARGIGKPSPRSRCTTVRQSGRYGGAGLAT